MIVDILRHGEPVEKIFNIEFAPGVL